MSNNHASLDDDIIIAVMGATGAGKSSFINLASGANLQVGYNLKSQTNKVETASYQFGGHSVVLVDTPGFDDTSICDTEILRTIADWLDITYKGGKRLSGIMYLHRITDNRVGGISNKNIRLFHKLCGKGAMHNVILCTTMWDLVAEDQGISREQELASDFWKSMIEEGAKIARHNGTLESAQGNINSLSSLQRVTLSIQESLAEGKTLLQTDVGMEIDKELRELEEKQKREREQAQREMEEAIRESNERAQRKMMEERAATEARLAREREEEQKRLEQAKRDMEEAVRQANERAQRKMMEERAAAEAARLTREREERAAIEARLAREREAERKRLEQAKRDMEEAIRKSNERKLAEERAATEARLAREREEQRRREAEQAAERERLQRALHEQQQHHHHHHHHDRQGDCRIL